ncbi:MAG TPA: bifunctional diaminohydroxyphosphoribosylaminopyrimidine deaminase/5-amino-6-(5-phosphoribosylamino)uracil reductase RibD, partial [Hansschlegelia sp.]
MDAAPTASPGRFSFSAQNEDDRWMAVALALARRGLGRTAPNPAVGAVIVAPGPDGGRVVGRGWTAPGGRPHAETAALIRAGDAARGATLYVTLEPCSHYGRTPPCADAVARAGVTRVVVAVADPDPRVNGQGLARLREAGVTVDLLPESAEARRLNAGHVTRVTRGRPRVALKLAVSADGKVAPPGGGPAAISGERSRARVHLMRAEADAIMIGVGTALADDPALTCRLPGMADRSPIRVLLDASLRAPVESRLVATAREVPTWIFCAIGADELRERALREAGAEVMRIGTGDD